LFTVIIAAVDRKVETNMINRIGLVYTYMINMKWSYIKDEF